MQIHPDYAPQPDGNQGNARINAKLGSSKRIYTMAPLPVEARLCISCLPRAPVVARTWGATHVLSLLDPDLEADLIPDCSPALHVIRQFHDRENDRYHGALVAAVNELIPLACSWLEAADARLLVHCHAGASRSTALTLALIAALQPERPAAEIFQTLLRLANKPWPNRDITLHADHLLGRAGTLVAVLDDYRATHWRRISAYRRLNRWRGLTNSDRMRDRMRLEGAVVVEPANLNPAPNLA
jgi:predicted protein tyrosine phosphatase